MKNTLRKEVKKMKTQTVILLVLALESAAVLLMALN